MATKKVRQRISYVLEIDAQSVGHRLGVNGLAVDSENSILYSGGRDGVVCAWDLRLDPKNDGLLKTTTTATSSPPLKTGTAAATPARHVQTATCRAQAQAHTHWINDIVLAQNNSALVTASSDLLVKIWRPRADYNDDEPAILGRHTDYVKCVSSPSQQSPWVASGGLDRRICLWDLSGGGKTLEIDVSGEEHTEKGSVYALQATHSLLASGGPESTVRLWDPRTGKNITKFVGHTDNVRAILVDDLAQTVLTASSDQTVKVWSITAGRCMHTLTMHNDSVWSLYAASPDLRLFYSSDRSGLVVKTDVRGSLDVDDGISVAVAQEHDGVSKLVASDGYVWTATSSSSINRWADVPTAGYTSQPPPPRPFPDTLRPHSSSVSTVKSGGGGGVSASAAGGPASASIGSPPGTSGGASAGGTASGPGPRILPAEIPTKSVLRISNTATFPARLAADAITLSGNSVRGEATSFSSTSGPGVTGVAASERRKNSEVVVVVADDAELQAVEPVHSLPVETIEGNFGLVKHRLLNDRRRALTLDTAGEVVLWDLIACKQTAQFGKRHLEDVEPEVNTLEAVAPWCSIDVSSGNLTVVLEEYNCFDAEMYADELKLEDRLELREDQRINLGKWILRYLFANLIEEEIRRDDLYRAKINDGVEKRIQAAASSTGLLDISEGVPTTGLVPPTPGISAATPLPTGGAVPQSPVLDKRLSQVSRPSVDREDYFSNGITSVETSNNNGLQPVTPGGTGLTKITTGAAEATTPATTADNKDAKDAKDAKTPTTLGKKFRMGMSFGTKKLGRSASTSVAEKPAVTDDKAAAAGAAGGDEKSESASSHEKEVVDDCFGGVIQRMHNEYDKQVAEQPNNIVATRLTPCQTDEAPALELPSNTKVIIQEELKGGSVELYRGTVASMGRPKDVDKIEQCAPMWLGEALLANSTIPKEAIKVSFMLLPYKDSLPGISTPDGSSRLNANRMLRVKKILAYVAERIEAKPAPLEAPAVVEGAEGADGAIDSAAGDEAADGEAGGATPAATATPVATATPEEDSLRPEEYLELYCNDQLLPINMSLATLRAHIWKNSSDIQLIYKSNGRKEIKFPPPPAAESEEQSADPDKAVVVGVLAVPAPLVSPTATAAA